MKRNWQIKRLGELCEFNRGLTYKKDDEVEISNNVVLRATNIDLTTNFLDFTELKYISDKVAVPNSKKVKKDSLMICTASGSKSHLGKVAYIDDDYDYAFGGFMGMITPKSDLISKYLFHLMTSDAYKNFINELADGANINNLRFDDLKEFQVPHPSRFEQQRIVDFLDEAFGGIAKAKANAQKNLQNARALFESHLNSIFIQRGKEWERKPLGELCELISGQHIDAKNYNTDSKGVGYLTGPSDFTLKNPIVTKWTEYPKRMAKRGDILITVKGSGVGKINLLDIEEVAISRQLMAVRAKASDVNYLYAFLSVCIDHFQSLSKGAAIPGISREDVLDLMCPMPPPTEQKNIVNLIHEVAKETQCLESIYQQKLAALQTLKKSILQQAFNGNL